MRIPLNLKEVMYVILNWGAQYELLSDSSEHCHVVPLASLEMLLKLLTHVKFKI